MVNQSLNLESFRLTLPEAVDLLVNHVSCDVESAREALERAIRDHSLKDIALLYPDGSEIPVDVKAWHHIDWEGGLVDYEGSWSGSPPTTIPVIPFLSREEFAKCFRISDANPATGKTRRRGRPTQHDWDGFWIEVCRRIHEEGIPKTQSELVRNVHDWFIGQRDESIDQRTIEKKISDLFTVLRRE